MVKKWEAESIAIQRQKAKSLRRKALRRRLYVCVSLCVLAYGGLLAWWIDHSGQLTRWQNAMDAQFQRAVIATGLTVRQVRIDGQQHIAPQQILQQAQIDPKRLILSLSLDDIRAQLLQHPQIASASVSRHLPNRIEIEVTERKPAAMWQNKGQKRLLDKDGKTLTATKQQLKELPPLMVVTGLHADKALPHLWTILQAAPEVASNVSAAQWVGNRRWTLWTKKGIKVMLPMNAPEKALAQLTKWQRENAILDRAVNQIDLRIDGMAYVRYQQDQEVTPASQTPLLTAASSGAI